jgi:undecaprenyl-diphosphatase
MSLLDALILGLIQGFTEFLPVSSSGHLVIGQALLDIQVPGVAFETAVHVATLLSVLLVFRKRVGALVVGAVRGEAGAWRYLGLLALATLPAVVVGLGARHTLEGLFEAPQVAGVALLITGGFLWTSRGAMARNPTAEPGVREAFLMGLAQAFAIIPGISRSGATVVAGLWLGVEAEEARGYWWAGRGPLGPWGPRRCRCRGPGHKDFCRHAEAPVLSPFCPLLLAGRKSFPHLPLLQWVRDGRLPTCLTSRTFSV